MSVGSFKPIPSEAKPSALPLIPPTLFISAPPNFSLLLFLSLSLTILSSLSLSPSALPLSLHNRLLLAASPSLFAGACGFHQLFRNYVARVSQLQGEPLVALNGHSEAFCDVCGCDVQAGKAADLDGLD